jgi:hypothetical protein
VSASRVLVAVGGVLALSVVAGVLWARLANPADWQVTSQGTILDEAAARGRFGVIVVFVVIGVAVSLLWGLVAGFLLRQLGWVLVPMFAALALAGALLAWRVGIVLGPPDPGTVRGMAVGAKIPQQLAVDAVAPFLLWPIFALVGLFVAVWSTGDGRDQRGSHRDEVGGTEADIEAAPTA